MTLKNSVPSLQVQAVLELIGSTSVSPGAGAAGAICLGLAAACASKAVAISLKHTPEDHELTTALETFQSVARSAMAEADRDSSAFEALVHDKRPSSAERLICEEEKFGRLIDAFTALLEKIAPRVQPNMAGDVFAAKVLAAAAQQIRIRNQAEARLDFTIGVATQLATDDSKKNNDEVARELKA